MPYGNNFEFRVQPHQGQRAGRYVIGGNVNIPFGAPVEVDLDAEAPGDRLYVELADGNTEPVSGLHGIALYEAAWEAFYGSDPAQVTFSDVDFAAPGRAVYLVSGDQVKIVLRNTDKRTMIDGIDDATPSVSVGDMLRPEDTPSDVNGYWKVAGGGEDGWLVVTSVDAARGEVEARFLF